MHDIGQSNMEHNFNEFGAGEVFAGESPLHEILAQEAPLHETAYEAPLAGEYHEAHFEAPYNEVYESYQELPAQEAAAFESYESPMAEAPNFEGAGMVEYREMAPQEADFAAARQFVRFASDTARRAQASAQGGVNPSVAVRQAVQGAAQQFAPALLSASLPPVRPPRSPAGRRGVWVRRGPAIILYGV